MVVRRDKGDDFSRLVVTYNCSRLLGTEAAGEGGSKRKMGMAARRIPAIVLFQCGNDDPIERTGRVGRRRRRMRMGGFLRIPGAGGMRVEKQQVPGQGRIERVDRTVPAVLQQMTR
jgi:hypothetical protein